MRRATQYCRAYCASLDRRNVVKFFQLSSHMALGLAHIIEHIYSLWGLRNLASVYHYPSPPCGDFLQEKVRMLKESSERF